MKASAFWKTIVADRSDFLDRLVGLFEQNSIRFCLIGGQAVNAYADPVVSLDLDVVIALDQVERVETLLADFFTVERFGHSLNVADSGSDLRVQIQTDPRYGEFVNRAAARDVMGYTLPVAAIEDLLQGKVWAASDASRLPSKRLKDLADIARILEVRPELIERVPLDIREKLT
jgi:hypothetical protein